MLKHRDPGGKYHPENPKRIRAIWDKLNSSGNIDFIKTISSKDIKTMKKSAKELNSIYLNEGSSEAAYLAAGSVIEAAEKVAKGELDSAFAIVRPPGHHAEETRPMGFCLYDNVAIAASVLLSERPKLGINKILIVDSDAHHGNSTQKMFYKDPRVLFFSVHRHESGRFYPYGNDGSYSMIEEGPGAGYNINVPWENARCGDADYFAVWGHILIPVAKEFDPDMIIISAGFDAAIGDPIGGCCLSSYGYSIMLDKFARVKIVMAPDGGYDPVSLANSTQACVEVLLQDKPLIRSLKDLPLESTWHVIQAVRQILCVYWPVVAAKLPDKVINNRSSHIEVSSRPENDPTVERTIEEGENENLFDEEEKFRFMRWRAYRLSRIRVLFAWANWREEEDWVFEWTGARNVWEAIQEGFLNRVLWKKRTEMAEEKRIMAMKRKEKASGSPSSATQTIAGIIADLAKEVGETNVSESRRHNIAEVVGKENGKVVEGPPFKAPSLNEQIQIN